MNRQTPATKVRYDYTKGSIRRGLLRLAVPVYLELTAWNIDVVIELYWVGQLGANALAAMSFGFMFLSIGRSFGMGIRTAGQALVAQHVGAGDLDSASLMVGQTIILYILFFTPIIIVGIVAAPHLMAMLTSDSEIIRLGTMYIRASFAMVLFIDGIFTLASMFRGAGEPGYSLMGMIVNTIGVFLSIPLLVYGAGPLPALGLAGTPLGLGAGRLLGVLLMLYFLFSGRCRIRLKLAHLRPHPAHLFRIIELGWPVWAQNLFERTANLVLISLISPFGALALAAWGVGNRVSQMGRMPGFALQGAVRTMVGQNIGGRRPDRARVAAWITISIVFSILLLTTIALFIWAEQIIHFFGLKGAAAPAGVICFRILCIGTLFEGTRRVVAGVFEGASQTKPPMFVEAIVRWMVMLPMAYVASTLFGMAEIGIWWAVSGSQVLGGLALFIWFIFGWRRKAYQENQVG